MKRNVGGGEARRGVWTQVGRERTRDASLQRSRCNLTEIDVELSRCRRRCCCCGCWCWCLSDAVRTHVTSSNDDVDACVGGTARLRDHYDALARGASSTLLQPRRHAAFHDNTLLIITSLSSPSSLSFVIVPAGGGWLYITIVSPNVFFSVYRAQILQMWTDRCDEIWHTHL